MARFLLSEWVVPKSKASAMKCHLILFFSFAAFAFSQSTVPDTIAAASMEVQRVGGNLVTVTPSAAVSFHAQGIDLAMNNGDNFRFHFNHGRLGNQAEVREVGGVKEVWYPRLYNGISLRCFVKADGEIGYDWKMAPGADASQVRMTMERQLAGQPANAERNTFVALAR